MSEINELTSLVGEMASMRERMATQEAELTALRSQVAGLGQGHSVAGSGLSLERVGTTPASRRKMLKLGAAAAAVGALGLAYVAPRPQMVLADDSNNPFPTGNGTQGGLPKPTITNGRPDGNLKPTATGNNLILGNGSQAPSSNATTGVDLTRMYNPGSTRLANILFQADNYSNRIITPPAGYRYAIVATSSGDDNASGIPVGLYGANDSYGIGVWGNSELGSGVVGQSTSYYGGYFSGGRAALFLESNGGTGAPTSGNHSAGELYRDGGGNLWWCAAGGTPGTWRRVAGPATAGSLQFASPPQRLTLATGVSGAIGNSLQNNVAAPINIRTRVTNAGAATGVIGVATVYAPGGTFGGGEYVLAAPGPSATQGVVLTASPGQNKSSAFVMVGVDATGVMSFNLQSGTNNTAMTFDVFGFYS